MALPATTPVDPSTAVLDATSDYLPEMAAIGAGAIAVGAALLVWRRGFGFFKTLGR